MEIKNEKIFKSAVNKFKILIISAASVLLTPGWSLAQTAGGKEISQNTMDLLVLIYVLITIIALGVLLFLVNHKEKPFVAEGRVTLWEKFKEYMVAATPIEKEDEILLEDDYDGIKELDNRIPPWFNYLFYATIIFGVIYLLNFYVFKTGKLQYQEYAAEMQAAEMHKAAMVSGGSMITAENVKRLTDVSALNAGKEIFKANCTPCHGADGGGIIGPNLTDDYWIHGGGIKNIFTTIDKGVLSKGMPNWSTKFDSKQIEELASYVMSLHGTHPKNPKPPQGNLYKGDDEKSD